MTDYRLRIFNTTDVPDIIENIISDTTGCQAISKEYDNAGWAICWACDQLSIDALNSIVDDINAELKEYHKIAIQRRPRISSELLVYGHSYYKHETTSPEFRDPK